MRQRVKELLAETGACAIGFAPAAEVEASERERFMQWLDRGWHGGMKYLERNLEVRFDPRLLLDDAKTIVSLAFNYRQHNPRPEIATYALGEDYHRVLRRHLFPVVERLKAEFGGEYRICIDSAPILERYWAQKAGIGYRSNLHGNLIVPGVGSMVFLAEIITTLQMRDIKNQISDARYQITDIKNQEMCPTGALKPGGLIDARRCINYLTIEHRGEWTAAEKELLEVARGCGRVFGCDICQLACRSNRGESAPVLPEFISNPDLPRRKSPLSRAPKNLGI